MLESLNLVSRVATKALISQPLAHIWETPAFTAALLTLSVRTTIAPSVVCDTSIWKDVGLFTDLTLGMHLKNLLIQAYD